MLVRTLLSLVNLTVLTVTIFVWLMLPQYATYALYACLAWVIVAFVGMYSTWGNRPLGSSARSVTAGAPLPSGAGGVRGGALPSGGAPLDFCIYCAGSLPAGARRCPHCGHAVA